MRLWKKSKRCYACGAKLTSGEVKHHEKDPIVGSILGELDVELIQNGLVCYNCKKYRK